LAGGRGRLIHGGGLAVVALASGQAVALRTPQRIGRFLLVLERYARCRAMGRAVFGHETRHALRFEGIELARVVIRAVRRDRRGPLSPGALPSSASTACAGNKPSNEPATNNSVSRLLSTYFATANRPPRENG
jgi:hypothetical protein